MPREVSDIKQFLEVARRKDAVGTYTKPLPLNNHNLDHHTSFFSVVA